jgi:hypothetical protein
MAIKFRVTQYAVIFLLAENLLAPQEGLCCMEYGKWSVEYYMYIPHVYMYIYLYSTDLNIHTFIGLRKLADVFTADIRTY